MANLLGQDIGLNYKGIITIGSTINQNISASLQSLTDGDGNLLPIQVSTTQAEINGNLSFIKTDGTGYIQSAWQSASPTGVASNTTLWFDSTGRINWRLGTGFIRTFDATGITADRVYVLPNATTTLPVKTTLFGAAENTLTFAGMSKCGDGIVYSPPLQQIH